MKAAAVLFLAAAVYCLCLPRFAANALLRLLRPKSEVYALNFIRFEFTPPGAQVPYGSAITVQGRAWKDGQPLPEVKLRVRQAGSAAIYSLADGGRHTFAQVTSELRCTLLCRGESSREYRIVPVRPPLPKQFQADITPPEYTGLPPQRIDLRQKQLPPILAGSAVTFSAGECQDLRLEGPATPPAAPPVTITAAANATILAKRPYGPEGTMAECWRGELRVQPDRPPEICFLNPQSNIQAGYGETLEVHLNALDDLGVAQVELILASGDRRGVFKRLQYQPPGLRSLRETILLPLTKELISPEQPLEIRAAATDGAGQRTETAAPLVVHFADLTQLLKQSGDTPGGQCYTRLMEALKLQQTQRDYTAAHTNDFTQRDADAMANLQRRVEDHLAGALRDAQENQLPENFTRKLKELLEQDARALSRSARDLKAQGGKPAPRAVNEIVLRQTALISRLQELLGIAGAQERQRLNQERQRQELEADKESYDATRQLQEKLQRFGEEQQRLAAETGAIDPKRAEDFSEAEEELLGDLAARQDELANFLKQAFSDYSKKAPQDFSNSTMADEFSEIFEELQRAGDALKAKHIEIATLAEDTALTTSQEISANIERWLADAKDYVKWNGEEDGLVKDTALADLPDELTDIIGDLIEEEGEEGEDEVQDSTNSFTWDTDQGMGWGVSDGNIDSMQAKGITGNVLPNKNEVGGRSGEGRSGQSHGQFVEKDAYGKGGRKTPTRLVQSPFEAGTVADHSKDPQGGATGGGKQSGVGGEGLVGNTPDQDTGTGVRTDANFAELRQRTEAALQRLAQRQLPVGELAAALRQLRTAEALGGTGGVDIRALASGAADALRNARAALAAAERAQLDERRHHALERLPTGGTGHAERIPNVYDVLVGEYFKSLAAPPPASPGGPP